MNSLTSGMDRPEGAGDLRRAARMVLVLFAVVALAGVLLRPLMPIDETRYLAVAWEMRLNGDWLVPTRNFALYSDKPPLLFWSINLVWLVTGVSEIAARLVSPAYAILSLWLTGRLAARLWPEDPAAGPRAVLALAAMPVFLVSGSLTMFDTMLTAMVLLGMVALCHAGEGRRAGWLGLGAAVALGVLAKGPVVLFHLLPAALTLPLWHRARPGWRASLAGLALGMGAAILLIGLWLVPAAILGGPEYRRAILWTQSAGRMASSFAHARPWWFFLALLPVLGFPWIFLPGLWQAARRASWAEPGLRLAAIWGGVAFLAFSAISGKQVHYLVPELPALALIAARLTAGRTPRLTGAMLPLGVIALVLILAGAGAIELGDAAEVFRPRSALLALGLGLVALIWASLRRHGLVTAALLAMALVTGLNLAIGLTSAREIYDSHVIASRIAPHEARGIAYSGQRYHAEFNFAARLTRPVAELDGPAEVRDWALAHPGGVLVGRIDRFDPGWPPAEVLRYRNTSYGIWRVPEAAQNRTTP